jgi:hypothetical protein
MGTNRSMPLVLEKSIIQKANGIERAELYSVFIAQKRVQAFAYPPALPINLEKNNRV